MTCQMATRYLHALKYVAKAFINTLKNKSLLSVPSTKQVISPNLHLFVMGCG